MRIGIFGGTFDPPHNGHLVLAQHLQEYLKLDTVIFVPSGNSYHKKTSATRKAHRFEMTKRVIEDNPFFCLSSIDLDRKGPTYTIDTVKELMKKFPHDKFYLLIGEDSAAEIHTWKDYKKLLKMISVVVINRPGSEALLQSEMTYKSAPSLNISSSMIRKLIDKKSATVRYMMPEKVWQYIKQNKLYQKKKVMRIWSGCRSCLLYRKECPGTRKVMCHSKEF